MIIRALWNWLVLLEVITNYESEDLMKPPQSAQTKEKENYASINSSVLKLWEKIWWSYTTCIFFAII